jgi:carboxyl-terminal processing protease
MHLRLELGRLFAARIKVLAIEACTLKGAAMCAADGLAMPKALKLSLLAISVLLIVFVFLGGILPGGVRASNASAYQQIEVYSEVLQHIQNDYVVTPNIGEVTTGAMHGLLEGLDPDSGYLTPAEFQKYQADKNENTAQIGLHISKRYGYATVVSVVPGGPADKAGIAAGDVIESIGTQSTRVMPLQMIELALDGQPGSTVSFSVIEPTSATPDAMKLTRTVTQYPALHVDEYENSSILYLKPYDLKKSRVQDVLARIGQEQKSGKQKILLDLRNVSDGDMDSAVLLASAFLKSGTIATLQGQKFPKQTWTADAENFVTDAPLMILINHSTCGPAEIVAAALKDNNRAQLVGDRTFGTGAVQRQIPLPDGAVLFLSVAKYHAPDGKAIQDDAVTPSVEVAENNGFGLRLYPPPDRGGPATKPTAPATAQPSAPPAQQDDQLNKALDLLKQQKAA